MTYRRFALMERARSNKGTQPNDAKGVTCVSMVSREGASNRNCTVRVKMYSSLWNTYDSTLGLPVSGDAHVVF